MTPSAFQVALFLFVLGLLFGPGCATTQTPDAAQREAIHRRHTWCIKGADEYASQHGVDAVRVRWCDEEGARACAAARLEKNCDQWEWGGT